MSDAFLPTPLCRFFFGRQQRARPRLSSVFRQPQPGPARPRPERADHRFGRPVRARDRRLCQPGHHLRARQPRGLQAEL